MCKYIIYVMSPGCDLDVQIGFSASFCSENKPSLWARAKQTASIRSESRALSGPNRQVGAGDTGGRECGKIGAICQNEPSSSYYSSCLCRKLLFRNREWKFNILFDGTSGTARFTPLPLPSLATVATGHRSPVVAAFPEKGSHSGFQEVAEAPQTLNIPGIIKAGRLCLPSPWAREQIPFRGAPSQGIRQSPGGAVAASVMFNPLNTLL